MMTATTMLAMGIIGVPAHIQYMPCSSPLIDKGNKVKKIAKRFTPFSYRHSAVEAFDRMFARFAKSTIVLSYSSNGYPDLNQLESLLRRHKGSVRVFERPHRYHFGTHGAVERAEVTEYLIVGH